MERKQSNWNTPAELLALVKDMDARSRATHQDFLAKVPGVGLTETGDILAQLEKQVNNGSKRKNSKELAPALGISARQVERLRTILDHASPETMEMVLSNQISLYKAYQESLETRNQKRLVQNPYPGTADLGTSLLTFLRLPIPHDNITRCWTAEETAWFGNLVIFLYQHAHLEKAEFEVLEMALERRKQQLLGGSLVSIPQKETSHARKI